jgi:Tfp pilus assembly protein PilP
LASLFGDSLERVTLWTKIDAALVAACAKVADADLDRFVSLCLETVRAEPARAAASEPLFQMVTTFAARPPEWRHAFVEHVRHRRFAVVAHGRARWEACKKGEIEP